MPRLAVVLEIMNQRPGCLGLGREHRYRQNPAKRFFGAPSDDRQGGILV